MASGYGITADSKDLLVVGGVLIALALIAWYIVDHAGDAAQNAIQGTATGIGNIPQALGIEPADQLWGDVYNWWEGLGES